MTIYYWNFEFYIIYFVKIDFSLCKMKFVKWPIWINNFVTIWIYKGSQLNNYISYWLSNYELLIKGRLSLRQHARARVATYASNKVRQIQIYTIFCTQTLPYSVVDVSCNMTRCCMLRITWRTRNIVTVLASYELLIKGRPSLWQHVRVHVTTCVSNKDR